MHAAARHHHHHPGQNDRDVIIVGAGVSGLYTALLLSKRGFRCIILEAQRRLGGRIMTLRLKGHDGQMHNVEAGAMRFSRDHKHTLRLLRQLHLASDSDWLPSSMPARVQPRRCARRAFLALSRGLKRCSSSAPQQSCKGDHRTKLDKAPPDLHLTTLSELLGSSHSFEELVEAAGFACLLNRSNAFDAVRILARGFTQAALPAARQSEAAPFWTLRGGMSTLITRLEHRLASTGRTDSVRIQRGTRAASFQHDERTGKVTITSSSGERFVGCRAFFCLPLAALRRIRGIEPTVAQLVGQGRIGTPLARVFAVFDRPVAAMFGGKILSAPPPLCHVAPLAPDIIMAAYADCQYARYWHGQGKDSLRLTVGRLLRQAFADDLPAIRGLPDPVRVRVCYWPTGVHYWAPMLRSCRSLGQVQPGAVVCGEVVNDMGWINGCLRSVQHAVAALEKTHGSHGSQKSQRAPKAQKSKKSKSPKRRRVPRAHQNPAGKFKEREQHQDFESRAEGSARLLKAPPDSSKTAKPRTWTRS
jgi:monoamine oxidase